MRLSFLPLLPALVLSLQGADLDREVLAMGTRLALHLEGPNPGEIRNASEAALAELARLEALGSTWRLDSEWSRLNDAGGDRVPLSPEAFGLLKRAMHWQRESGGAFDPALGALVEAWGLRTGGRVPSPEGLKQAREASGARWLHLDASEGSARLGHPKARIEEGSFLKGAALDAIRTAAAARGISSGLLDFGGQILCWGPARRVEVADPGLRTRARLSLTLKNASLAGSGCSERGRHILNPRTGQPCPDWGSVAVVMGNALDADALSTALFVMGPVRGLAWAEARGIAACFLPRQGPCRMSAAFRALNPMFTKELK